MLLPEDGGRPPKHLGGKIVYFLYILCTWKVLPFEVFCGLSLVPMAKFRNNTVPQNRSWALPPISFSIHQSYATTQSPQFHTTKEKCEIWGSDSNVAKDSSLLGCDALSLGKQFPTFWKTLVPSSLKSSSPRLPSFKMSGTTHQLIKRHSP